MSISIKKIKCVSCEKNADPAQVAKGDLYKVVVQILDPVTAKSRVELKPGEECDVETDGGTFTSKEGEKVSWLKLLCRIVRK